MTPERARDVSVSTRQGRTVFRVGGRVFAVAIGPGLVVVLPAGRASALVRAGLAQRLDPGGDSLIPGWVALAPCAELRLRLLDEARRHARAMSPAGPRGHTTRTVHLEGGTMSSAPESPGFGSAPFVWFDLRTTDRAATLAFYRELLHWKIDGDSDAPAAMIRGSDGPWAAVAQSPSGSAQWVPYVQVDDIDAAAEKAGGLGAKVLQAKTRGPAGEFAVIADPEGAMIALWQPPAA